MVSHERCINVVNALLRSTLGKLDVHTQIRILGKLGMKLPDGYGQPSDSKLHLPVHKFPTVQFVHPEESHTTEDQ